LRHSARSTVTTNRNGGSSVPDLIELVDTDVFVLIEADVSQIHHYILSPICSSPPVSNSECRRTFAVSGTAATSADDGIKTKHQREAHWS